MTFGDKLATYFFSTTTLQLLIDIFAVNNLQKKLCPLRLRYDYVTTTTYREILYDYIYDYMGT